MKRKSKGLERSVFSIGGVMLMLVLVILVNYIFAQVNWRWDMTEDRLYSLSEGSRQVLSDLKQDVTLKVFYSSSVVNTPVYIKTYANRMLDFLKEYEHYSDGRVRVERYDPKIDSEEEEWAQKYGIERFDLPTGDRIYLGLAATAADQQETIAFLDPAREQHLEYDITRMIARVQSARRPKIAVISSLPVFGNPRMGMGMAGPAAGTQPWLFVTELQKTSEVQQLPPTAEALTQDLDLLVLIHPQNLSELLQYAIDQYVLKGGKILAFLDPLSVTNPAPAAQASPQSLDKLLAAWGVEMNLTEAVADFGHATRLRDHTNQIEINPFWLSLPPEAINASNIITANLESLLMPVAGTFTKRPDSEVELEPLLSSSKQAQLFNAAQATFGLDQVRKEFEPADQRYHLAVMVTGNVKTAFADGRPQPAATDDTDSDKAPEASSKSHLAESQQPTTMVLVSDSDMLFDGYYVSKQNFLGFEMASVFNDNLNLLLNACEMLTGSEALIGIRSRGKFERPFTRVQALEQKAQSQWLTREQELERKMEQTNQKLQALEQQKSSAQKLILSPEQEEEIRKFQEEKQRINQELKIVRRNLRAEIESLGRRIKFLNIFLMPALVALAGICYALYERRRM